MNIRYARAATLVIPITIAILFPEPSTICNSSVSIKFVIENTVARVPTTFSFAKKPVIAAAASCQQTTPTTGTSKYAKGDAINARIESDPLSAATLNEGVKPAIS